jgi:hypothetical protein
METLPLDPSRDQLVVVVIFMFAGRPLHFVCRRIIYLQVEVCEISKGEYLKTG